MLFTTGAFLAFFFVFFHLYWLAQSRRAPLRLINAFILIGSYYFYGFWNWRLLGLILISSLVDYACGLRIERTASNQQRKWWLFLSLLINLGMLGTFKYFNFFGESFAELLQLFGFDISWTTRNIVLPVGISFYTFQSLSYTVDVYRRKIKAEKDILAFSSYVAFFPQLVAGPIERAGHLLPQFHQRKVFYSQQAIEGFRLILYGFFQKLVIADNLGIFVNAWLEQETYTGATLLLVSLAFSLQIFCDFAGYSNMAIGIGRLLGFDLRRNFRSPYSAQSIREFWQRWHISLSNWFRDYVYIPLGGSRSSQEKNA
ncbi:MAG: MBOAT family O-acyltransferase, partial [Bacteroidota bacterium]